MTTLKQNVFANRVRDASSGALVAVPTGYKLYSDGTGAGTWALGTNFAEFTYSGAVAVATTVPFSFNSSGPASVSTTITQSSPSRFVLGSIGTYRVVWNLRVDEAGKALLSADLAAGTTFASVARSESRGVALGQISGSTFITTTVANVPLELRNSTGSSLTPTAALTSNIMIQQVL